LRFALVRLPRNVGSEQTLKLALFDTKNVLTWSSPELTGNPAQIDGEYVKQDSTGHVFVTLFMGAHASALYVIDPRDGHSVQMLGLEDGAGASYSSDTPDAHAQDVDGDGVLELVVPQNDYDPSYAEGSVTSYVFTWTGAAYSLSACTYYPHGSSDGTNLEPGDPNCDGG